MQSKGKRLTRSTSIISVFFEVFENVENSRLDGIFIQNFLLFMLANKFDVDLRCSFATFFCLSVALIRDFFGLNDYL